MEVVVLHLKDPQQAEEVAEAPAAPKPSFAGYHLNRKNFHVKYDEESFAVCICVSSYVPLFSHCKWYEILGPGNWSIDWGSFRATSTTNI